MAFLRPLIAGSRSRAGVSVHVGLGSTTRVLSQHRSRLFSSVVWCTRPNTVASNVPKLPVTFHIQRSYLSTKQTPTASSSSATETTSTTDLAEAAVEHSVVGTASSTLDPSASEYISRAVDTSDALLSSIPPPIQLGDFAALGIASWSPAGIVRWSFELVNVFTGLPWFWTIVVGTVLWRLAMVPITIKGLRNNARMTSMGADLEKLKPSYEAALKARNTVELQLIRAKQKRVMQEHGYSASTTFLSFLQIPVSLGLFLGVKKLCSLPVEQLKYSGVDFLPDLTVADPTWILPLAVMAAVNLQITVSTRDIDLVARPQMGHVMNGLRLLSGLAFIVMSGFPSGLMLSLFVTSMTTAASSFVLQIPKVRKALDIPIIPQGHKPSFMESVNWVIKRYQDKIYEAKRQQQNLDRWR